MSRIINELIETVSNMNELDVVIPPFLTGVRSRML